MSPRTSKVSQLPHQVVEDETAPPPDARLHTMCAHRQSCSAKRALIPRQSRSPSRRRLMITVALEERRSPSKITAAPLELVNEIESSYESPEGAKPKRTIEFEDQRRTVVALRRTVVALEDQRRTLVAQSLPREQAMSIATVPVRRRSKSERHKSISMVAFVVLQNGITRYAGI